MWNNYYTTMDPDLIILPQNDGTYQMMFKDDDAWHRWKKFDTLAEALKYANEE